VLGARFPLRLHGPASSLRELRRLPVWSCVASSDAARATGWLWRSRAVTFGFFSGVDQRIHKGLCLLPRALVEQIVMGALGKEFNPLWLVSCAVDLPAHFHRDHRVLLAVQDENRRLDEADVALWLMVHISF
jgi:hypothetical protein